MSQIIFGFLNSSDSSEILDRSSCSFSSTWSGIELNLTDLCFQILVDLTTCPLYKPYLLTRSPGWDWGNPGGGYSTRPFKKLNKNRCTHRSIGGGK